MTDNTILQKILSKYNIDIFGICDFNNISSFIDCTSIKRIPGNSKSVIIAAFPYYVGEFSDRNISKYAIVNDYHKVINGILKNISIDLYENFNNQFVYFTDSSPFPEVELAIKSGLGFRGLNSLLITTDYGSYVFLGEIVTDKYFEPTNPIENTSCIKCRKCITACPGKAISSSGIIDYNNCISFITQKKGDLSEKQIELVKQAKSLWGCDICQDICPHNVNIKHTRLSSFLTNIIHNINFNDIDQLIKSRAFGFRGPKPIKRNYKIIYGD